MRTSLLGTLANKHKTRIAPIYRRLRTEVKDRGRTQNRVDFVFGLARNTRLETRVAPPSKRPGPRLRRRADLRACSGTFSGPRRRRGPVGGA